jgi:type IV pilus assembly protein PilB
MQEEDEKKEGTLPEIVPVPTPVVGEEAPIIKTVSVIVRHAVEGRASDIHVEPLDKETRVRFRVDGILHSSLILPKDIHSQIVSRVKILSNLKLDETRIPQDGRFRMSFEEKNIDFRVSIFPTSQGEKVVMRILDPTVGIRKLEDLGWQGINLEKIQRGISKPFGMTLVTGPTGSGKSTTLASVMAILNRESINMVSLEDPIEYYLDGVSQSQVRPELGYTFASGLRSILRQDPDAIMVGEVRDPETAELVIHASLTGHIVLSTLHTNNVIGVVPRLIDMGVDHYLIPSTLNIAAAQRLVRKLCPHCKKEIKPPAPKLKIIEEVSAEIPDEEKKRFKIKPPYTIYEAEGCPKCGNKGTIGRLAICEVMEMTKEFERLILKKPSESEVEEEGRRQKVMTLKMDAMIKVLQGHLGFDEAIRVVELREEDAPIEMRVGK